MQVARRDVVVVLAHELIEGLRAVAMLVVAVSGLHFPIVDDVRVGVTGRGELVAERVLGLLERLERLLEERALWT